MRRWTPVVFGLLLGAGCSSDVTGDGGIWEVDHVEQDGVLTSVWGTGSGDVWAAGGRVGESLLLHDDGDGWAPVDVGADQLLWWIYGFSAADLYAVGEGGLILHYDGERWQRVESGTDATLFGIWGSSGSDVWIVGGDPTGEPGTAVVLRGHGTDFAVVDDIPAEVLPAALYKIYGGPLGVVAVGSAGAIVAHDGVSWSRVDAPTREPIFSLWGRAPDDVFAVGGSSSREILHFDGDDWTRVEGVSVGPGLSGVFTAPDQPMIAVGPSATIVELDGSGLELEPSLPGLPSAPDLHGVWGDGTGTAFAVGGDLFAYPALTSGVILRRR